MAAESGHHSRHETAHATKQGQEREETGLEEAGDAREETAESTRHADEEPHEKGVAIGLADRLLVFVDIHAVASQKEGSYGNADPDEVAPIFLDDEDGSKLQQEEDDTQIAHRHEETLADGTAIHLRYIVTDVALYL